MAGLAAVLVLVACPASYGDCLQEPVRVVSYASPAVCDRQLPIEIAKAKQSGMVIYGSCNSVGAELLAGRSPINIQADPEVFKQERLAGLPESKTTSFANTSPNRFPSSR